MKSIVRFIYLQKQFLSIIARQSRRCIYRSDQKTWIKLELTFLACLQKLDDLIKLALDQCNLVFAALFDVLWTRVQRTFCTVTRAFLYSCKRGCSCPSRRWKNSNETWEIMVSRWESSFWCGARGPSSPTITKLIRNLFTLHRKRSQKCYSPQSIYIYFYERRTFWSS